MKRHPLEVAFDFDDRAFRSFIHTEKLTIKKLEVAHENMADSDNPIVRYTAGWALAELGLFKNYRAQNNGLTLEDRNKALDNALACWKGIGKNFMSFASSQTEDLNLEVRDLDIRRRQAMAYIPSMRLGAATIARERFTKNETQQLRKQTFTQAVHISRAVVKLPEDTERQRARRAGLANEALCGLVDLNMPSGRYAPSPASIRHDHHPEVHRRSDFMVIGGQSPRKIMQQIKPYYSRPTMNMDSRMIVTPNHDLLPPGFLKFSAVAVLEELHQQVADGAKPWESELLAEPGQRMEACVEAFQETAWQ